MRRVTELRAPPLSLERAAHHVADHPDVGPDDGVVVAIARQNPGRVVVELGYAGLAIEDAELVAGHMLRDVRAFMANDDNGANHCPACARRWARVCAALAALEDDGGGAAPVFQSRTMQ